MGRNLLKLRILLCLPRFPPSMNSSNPLKITPVDQFPRVDIIHPHVKIGNVNPVISPPLEFAEYGFCDFSGGVSSSKPASELKWMAV